MNELKTEDVMRALELKVQRYLMPNVDIDGSVSVEDAERWFLKLLKEELAPYVSSLLREKDAEIERLTKERDDARRDCAIAEQNHYECKKELEEMSDDILDSVRAERDRYKAESKQYQSALLKYCCEHEYDYSRGWNDAITEFAERLKKFYSHLKGNTASGSVEYHIDQIEKELKGEKNNDHQN